MDLNFRGLYNNKKHLFNNFLNIFLGSWMNLFYRL